jgi:hypothetical protein
LLFLSILALHVADSEKELENTSADGFFTGSHYATASASAELREAYEDQRTLGHFQCNITRNKYSAIEFASFHTDVFLEVTGPSIEEEEDERDQLVMLSHDAATVTQTFPTDLGDVGHS